MQKARFTLYLALMLGLVTTGLAIDCYKCTSINGMLTACEDTFDRSTNTVHLISRECVYSHFKGTHCIKLTGERDDGTKIMVRDCSDSDWGSHCGKIRYIVDYSEHIITGCLEACSHDGCNKATQHAPDAFLTFLLTMTAAVTFLAQRHFWRIFFS